MSPTTREVTAAKDERLRRARRYFTPDKLGRPCPVCTLRVPLALNAITHPTCDPNE